MKRNCRKVVDLIEDRIHLRGEWTSARNRHWKAIQWGISQRLKTIHTTLRISKQSSCELVVRIQLRISSRFRQRFSQPEVDHRIRVCPRRKYKGPRVKGPFHRAFSLKKLELRYVAGQTKGLHKFHQIADTRSRDNQATDTTPSRCDCVDRQIS